MGLLESALEYYDMGFSVFPCLPDKKPSQKWLQFQKERASVDQIKKWWGNGSTSPIAIVTGKISGIVVVDVDDTDIGFKNLANYIPPDVKTPMAKTPSGGYHLFFKYPEQEIRNNAKAIPGCDFRGDGGYVIASPSFCSYEKGSKKIEGSYEWIENQSIKDIALSSLSVLYISYINSFSLYKGGVDNEENGGVYKSLQSLQKSTYFIEGRRDEDIFHIANALVKGRAKQDVAIQALKIIAQNCTPPFPENEIGVKIQSALERGSRREKNLASDVEEFVLSTNGVFLSTEVHKGLQLSTREENKNLSIILKRLKEKGLIEKVGDRNGCWKLKEQEQDNIIDWRSADDKEYPIKLPLNIMNFVKIYPGNIIIIAGASNVGKTSFMLETVRLNQKIQDVYYFNSEMGASELKTRLLLFSDVINLDAWNFTAIERSMNFAESIKPGKLNIIDFMEVYDDFWKIGGWIRDIHNKLDGGVAVIAVQKKASTKKETQDYGRGGELTIEKPRLYLAMDRGRIKIIKAKAWRDHNQNPNGMIRQFNILQGWKFKPKTDWINENEEKERDKKEQYSDYGIGKPDKDFPHEE